MYGGIQTFGAVVRHRAGQQPERTFARFEDRALTYAQLEDGANRVANAVSALGIGRGDRVAVMLPNGPEYLWVWTGLTHLGVIEVPVNTAFKGDLLGYVLAKSNSRVLVIAGEWVDRLPMIMERLTELEHVIVAGTTDGSLDRVPVHPLADLMEAAEIAAPAVDVDPTDPAVILFTSGTTGPSKGAVLCHRANFRLAQNVSELMGYGEGERLFTVFPLFHVNARYTTVLPALYVDGDVVMHDRFSASGFWDFCRAEGVTAFNYMGALLMMLFKQPERDDDAANPVRRAYGAPAPIEIYREFEDRYAVQLVEVYGSTELGTATMNTVESFKVGSCGRAVPYFDVEIHDEHDNRCRPGVDGEIVVRPREPYVMFSEYHGDPEATVAAFRNLWFHTGDRGRVDEDGYFTFVDRMKDAIRRRGENISSYEVEQVVNDHEAVLEAAAIGVPSELTEEEVMIIVQLKPGVELTPEALLDHCQPRMAHFALPRYVRFVADLPRTPSQRIEKYKLRETAVTADTWDRERAGYEVKR